MYFAVEDWCGGLRFVIFTNSNFLNTSDSGLATPTSKFWWCLELALGGIQELCGQDEGYGYMGCGAFKREVQNLKEFCLKST